MPLPKWVPNGYGNGSMTLKGSVPLWGDSRLAFVEAHNDGKRTVWRGHILDPVGMYCVGILIRGRRQTVMQAVERELRLKALATKARDAAMGVNYV